MIRTELHELFYEWARNNPYWVEFIVNVVCGLLELIGDVLSED